MVAKVDDICLWHKIFFHVNFDSIVKASNVFVVRDLPKIVKPTNTICKECVWQSIIELLFPSRNLLL